MEKFIAILGLALFVLIAFSLSQNKKLINVKLIFWGFFLQFIFALLILGIPSLGIAGPLKFLFVGANDFILSVIGFTQEGSRFMFGDLMNVPKSGFIIALQILPTIIFFSAFISIFYHLGIMQKIVKAMAYLMYKFMNVSGAESLSMAANIFVGQTEAPLVIKPYIEKMTQSELFALMVGGMATVAGGVLVSYVSLLKEAIPGIGGHLLTASVMSAPAALLFAKVMIPETEKPMTLGFLPTDKHESETSNVIDAAAHGASVGLKMALNVGAMLLAFIALIAALNSVFKLTGNLIGFESWGQQWVPEMLTKDLQGTTITVPLSFQMILGWIFSPVAWLMGIPWNEVGLAGSLLGEKLVLNEFVAYVHLADYSNILSERSMTILSYALCGFANFSSIAIQIGGIGELAPSRRHDLAKLGIRSIIGGSLAAFSTACIAGLLI
ncbi:MAG: hypothetical protein KDD50_16630 [Bdellovibrionales bacterium]|nr:hypothetical protein [Bdellovibrionales bacterium]